MYWTCGQCCLSHVQVVRSNIAIGLTYWTCGQCCVFHTWVLASNIAIRVYVLDIWSVLCVMYVGGMFKYSDWNVAYWICGQCFVFHMWLLGSNIAIIIRSVRTGHVVSVVCSVSWWWDLI